MFYHAVAQLITTLGLSAHIRAEVLIAIPKLVQALFAAEMDLFTYKLAARTYGLQSSAARAALFLTMASPWQAFCSVRTLSNSIETSCTIGALCLWPWDWFMAPELSEEDRTTHGLSKTKASQEPHSWLYQSLFVAAMACILRPTNIVIWTTVSVTLLIRFGSVAKLLKLAQAAVISGGAILAISVGADRTFYGAWVFPPLRFLQFNLFQSLAVFYGKNRPDYYFTEALPLLLTTALPFAAIGLWRGLRCKADTSDVGQMREQTIRSTLAITVITSVLLLSLISHKEVRFIYPILPMLHVLAAKPLASFFTPFPRPTKPSKRVLLFIMVCTNLFIGWYTLFVHQRGVIDVMHFLRGQHEVGMPAPLSITDSNTGAEITTVGFLMPCHSTPWRSHLVHPDIHAWALTCEPPVDLSMSERETYMDEADVFYNHPGAWIISHIGDIQPEFMPWPQYLVFFEHLESTLQSVLKYGDRDRYEEVWRGFNTHWHDDARRKGDVFVWRKRDYRNI